MLALFISSVLVTGETPRGLEMLRSLNKKPAEIDPATVDNRHLIKSIRSVGKLIDSYLQVVARDDNMPVSKFVSLAETVPAIGRLGHDDLYQAINIYLKVNFP